MAVYNGEKYLREAIESILDQTYTNFEFLIINDGSSDKTEEIILSYNDKRIRYIKNEQNLKLIASLNKGLDLAKGKYIARMDADDISMPKRLEKQVEFLEKHPKVGLLGTWVRTRGLKENYDVHFEQGHSKIRARLFLTNYIHHPTVMVRMDVLNINNLHYPNVPHAEDYALWIKLSEYCELEIFPEVLLNYRVHEQNISVIHKLAQVERTQELRRTQFDDLNILYTAEALQSYVTFLHSPTSIHRNEFANLLRFIEQIVSKIPKEFKHELQVIYLNSLYACARENNCLNELKNSTLYPSLTNRIIERFLNFLKIKK